MLFRSVVKRNSTIYETRKHSVSVVQVPYYRGIKQSSMLYPEHSNMNGQIRLTGYNMDTTYPTTTIRQNYLYQISRRIDKKNDTGDYEVKVPIDLDNNNL